MKNKKNLSLYIHIPFCIRKCKYCDFLSFSSTDEDRNSYIQELKKEIMLKSQWALDYQVISIFFGGGTPSLLSGDQMTDIMNVISRHYHVCEDAEITTEANPGTLSAPKLMSYRKAGINRLSIGLQSADNHELKMLGRIHSYEDFLEMYHSARNSGFDNINIDLMSALPGQSLYSYEETLHKVLELNPEHISAYSLIVEEGTPLSEDDALLATLPDEEIDRKMYQMTKELLQKYGYERYEISNYAKSGRECIHNTVYWTGGDYLGFGLGASSYFQGERFTNEFDLGKYRFDGERLNLDRLSKQDRIEEFMFLGMRMTKGISIKEFHKRFNCDIFDVYGTILEKQQVEGLIARDDNYIRLTDRGLDVSNYVFCDYLL